MQTRWDLFVFDWDGTILDTTYLIARGIQAINAQFGFEVPSLELARSVIGGGMRETMQTVCPECPESRWNEYIEAYRQWYFAREKQVTLFEGIPELLTSMHDKGWRLAVATGKSREGLDRALASTGLRGLFEETITAEETFAKPNPEMLYELSARTAVPCERMVMVGDATFDILMAKNAGASSIGVCYAGNPEGDLKACGAVQVAHSVNELATFLGVHA